MSEPDDEHLATAERILGEALDELERHGFDYVEAHHAMAIMAIDGVAGGLCRECLPTHYAAMRDRLETRIAEIPDLVPGKDCAIGCSGGLH
jgi:hypothetical protein